MNNSIITVDANTHQIVKNPQKTINIPTLENLWDKLGQVSDIDTFFPSFDVFNKHLKNLQEISMEKQQKFLRYFVEQCVDLITDSSSVDFTSNEEREMYENLSPEEFADIFINNLFYMLDKEGKG